MQHLFSTFFQLFTNFSTFFSTFIQLFQIFAIVQSTDRVGHSWSTVQLNVTMQMSTASSSVTARTNTTLKHLFNLFSTFFQLFSTVSTVFQLFNYFNFFNLFSTFSNICSQHHVDTNFFQLFSTFPTLHLQSHAPRSRQGPRARLMSPGQAQAGPSWAAPDTGPAELE